jgi:hypothetical protein
MLEALERTLPGWTQVSLTESSCAIRMNDYVRTDVFEWLETQIGPMTENYRVSKYARSDEWAYSVGGPMQTTRVKPPGFSTRRVHVFFFKNPSDAVRFKLTWA